MPRGVYQRGNSVDVGGEAQTLPDVEIPVTGELKAESIKPAADPSEIEPHYNMSSFNEKAAILAFMEEPVTIHLHDSSNPNEEAVVFCSVNGEGAQPGNPWLRRGQQYTLKRKFVLNLATAKTVSYSQPFKDETTNRANHMRPQVAVRYPFSVIEDRNPKGAKWLAQLLGR